MKTITDFAGRVAVVTGAASGIGLGLALHAAKLGMSVALADVEEPPLEAALGKVRAMGAKAIARRVDVSDPQAVNDLATAVSTELGDPWLLCNNAGVNKFKPSWAFTQTERDWIVGVNLGGVINGIRAFVPGLVTRNDGYVVNTASAAGLYATPGAAAYVATKHAVVGLSECLYRELIASGKQVGVSVVCPKLVATNMMTATRNEPGVVEKPSPVDMSKIVLPADAKPDIQTPAALAEKVFEAICRRQFWVLSHLGTMRETLLNRTHQMVNQDNPDETSTDKLSSYLSCRRAGLIGTIDAG